ncbi:uncharacterized protein PGTG_19188 [Puccinia graminis f. sp. tritici CRL 75-36-700-3]|uniref:Uncharacterized protein n=1 Tax=Puccinia graminis f. sp. tritici (strain CRL 75-36-700-3 / race SCCL) TaxID=418459 RepID=E3L9L7_PUCGT|nr:uncharacterized protein PGTG_19188 [Puccinia graminis f. sp. tritici CRL 75-36-700-3]EFP93242.2 hypothetical protein PGTG_19188 [Puccinia graminis f. sp. tritici CRL 75-36-700-3]
MALLFGAQGRRRSRQFDGEGCHALCGASKEPVDKRSYLLGSDLSPGAWHQGGQGKNHGPAWNIKPNPINRTDKSRADNALHCLDYKPAPVKSLDGLQKSLIAPSLDHFNDWGHQSRHRPRVRH